MKQSLFWHWLRVFSHSLSLSSEMGENFIKNKAFTTKHDKQCNAHSGWESRRMYRFVCIKFKSAIAKTLPSNLFFILQLFKLVCIEWHAPRCELFHFILECFIQFCSLLFCSVLFCSFLFANYFYRVSCIINTERWLHLKHVRLYR